jgi:hypothetical protein
VLADEHGRKELGERRQLGQVPHRAAHCGASVYVFGPDREHRLARDGQPAARLTRDLDQRGTRRRQMVEGRTSTRLAGEHFRTLAQARLADAGIRERRVMPKVGIEPTLPEGNRI